MVMVFHMKLSIVSLFVIASVCSFGANAMSVTDAAKNVANAEHAYDAAQRNYNNAAHQMGNGVNGSTAQNIMNHAAANRAQAYADQQSAEMENQSNVAHFHQIQKQQQQQQSIANYGIKGNPNLTPQVNVPGYVVSKHPPFAGESWSNGRGANNGSHDHSGTGNGSNNAANSNSSHGLGGGDHIGGGRSGGGYHY